MPRANRFPPSDELGHDIRVGDWVRVVRVPDSIADMPRDTKRAFSGAMGKTFQVEAFDGFGCLELDLSDKVGPDTVWIEPFCVRRFRRPKRYSARFRKILAVQRRLERPRWSLRYVGKYRANDDPQRLVAWLRSGWMQGQGWYILENRREIHGTFYAPDRTRSSRRRLQEWRAELKKGSVFAWLRLGGVRLTGA